MLRRIYVIIAFLGIITALLAQQPLLRLPAILSDHAVLQQNSEIKFWGWSAPRATIRIIPEWSNDTVVVKTDEKAKWEIYLKTPVAGGPYKIKVMGYKKSITLHDIMIGEVWLCSGQSNMEWSASKGIIDAKEDQPNATNKDIRFFFIEKATADCPQDDCHGYWKVCTPESMEYFSAVGYFFGKNIQNKLNVPVGLINSNWGGTVAETWTPAPVIISSPLLSEALTKLKPSSGWDNTPGSTYNAMIRPIIKMKLAGVIWYQGEANCPNAYTYSELFQSMIQSWREKFQSNLPFYYVQIAPYSRYPIPYSAAIVREQQEKASSMENTGMVVTSDLVDNIKDIHPRYKKEVGNRLAAWALANTYKQNITSYRHPVFKEIKIEKKKARIYFNYAEEGLMIKGKEIEGLELAGEDGKYYPATGTLAKDNSLWVEAKEVKNPVHVRFAFSNEMVGNLFTKSGLPVAPFRTDNEVFDLSISKK